MLSLHPLTNLNLEKQDSKILPFSLDQVFGKHSALCQLLPVFPGSCHALEEWGVRGSHLTHQTL